MKKTISLFLFALCCLTSFAQLKVYTNGNVGIKSSLDSTTCHLSVGNRTYGSGYDVYLSSSNLATNLLNIGVDGWAFPSSPRTVGRTIGVRGIAGNCASGYNYGVLGSLFGQKAGAAVYGSVASETGTKTDGRYAGYFNGDVCVTGCDKSSLANAYDISDENASDLSDVFDIIALLHPIERSLPMSFGNGDPSSPDGVSATDDFPGMTGMTRYAFNTYGSSNGPFYITDDASHKYVDNTQVIPVLVAAVKELYAMVSDLRSQSSNSFMSDGESEITGSETPRMSPPATCRLFQNTPNPFTGSTIIRYSLPEDVSDALICVFNMQGSMLSQTPVSGSSDRITINGSDYGPGMYIYSLIVNGREMDSKRMILTK